MKDFEYPKSFPNKEEILFLKLLLSKDDDFLNLWERWNKEVSFDSINYATLRLMPFLYLRLNKFDIKDGKYIGRIKGMYKMAWYKNQLVFNSLKKIISVFNKENISMILLKGVPILENVYKDRGARYLGDADILIDKKYIKKSIEIMNKNDWSYYDPSPFYKNRFIDLSKNRVDKEITFINKNGVELDIHWDLFPFILEKNKDHPMNYDEILKFATECELDGFKYKMPCVEDMIIHIILHGVERNNHSTLRWVVDVVTIIKNKNIKWDFLIERIKLFECEVELFIAFSFILNNFDIKIPNSFVEKLNNLSISESKIKDYYKKANTIDKTLFGTFLYLWNRYWLYDKKGNIFVSWYYFIDYLCVNWGILNKWKIFSFIFEKYLKRIRWILKK